MLTNIQKRRASIALLIAAQAIGAIACSRLDPCATDCARPTPSEESASAEPAEPNFLTRRELFQLSSQLISTSEVGRTDTGKREFAIATVTVSNTTDRPIPREASYECVFFDADRRQVATGSASRVDTDLNPGESKTSVLMSQIDDGAGVDRALCQFEP